MQDRPAWRNPGMYRQLGLVPERETVYPFLTGREFAIANARQQGLADIDGAARRRPSTWSTSEMPPTDASGRTRRGCGNASRWRRHWSTTPRCSRLTSPSTAWIRASGCTCSNCCGTMAAQGRTVLLSSHILEEVERMAESVLVIYAGRLAASGDFRSIRRLMTDRPHVFHVRSTDDRQLAAALLRLDCVFGVELESKGLVVRTSGLRRVHQADAEDSRGTTASPCTSSARPTIHSSPVFAYLVGR